MTTTTAKEERQAARRGGGIGSSEPFGEIDSPGCYVWARTGDLLRVPPDELQPGRSPRMDIVSADSTSCTKISNDPYVSLSKARSLAADMDLPVNF